MDGKTRPVNASCAYPILIFLFFFFSYQQDGSLARSLTNRLLLPLVQLFVSRCIRIGFNRKFYPGPVSYLAAVAIISKVASASGQMCNQCCATKLVLRYSVNDRATGKWITDDARAEYEMSRFGKDNRILIIR